MLFDQHVIKLEININKDSDNLEITHLYSKQLIVKEEDAKDIRKLQKFNAYKSPTY